MPPDTYGPHDYALARAGDVFMWAIHTGPSHEDATPEAAAEQIIAMYLREVRDTTGFTPTKEAARLLLSDFPEKRR